LSKAVIKSFILGKDGVPLILDYSVKEGLTISRGELSELIEQEKAKLEEVKLRAKKLTEEANRRSANIMSEAERTAAIITNNAQQEANRMVERARVEAAHIRRDAEAEAEAIKAAAREDGLRAGREEGAREVREEMAAVIAQVESILHQAKLRREEIMHNMEEEIIDLVLAIARKIVKEELSFNKEIVINNVKEALDRANEKENITIRVNTVDAETVNNYMEEFLASIGETSKLTIVEDANISPGGCIIDTDFGRFDARIDTQLAQIEENFEKAIG
jgi:flagellar assembly protein FliH